MPPIFAFAFDFSPKVMTFLIAMLPISELRGAIPYAMWAGGLGWKEAYVIAVLGNFLPVIPLLLFMEKASECVISPASAKRSPRRVLKMLKAQQAQSSLAERHPDPAISAPSELMNTQLFGAGQ